MSLNELMGELSSRIMIPLCKHHPDKANMTMGTLNLEVRVVT